MSTMYISETIAEFAAGLCYEQIPEKVRERAKYLMLDAIGIAFASARFDFAHRTLTALSGMGPGDEGVIGMPARLSLRDSVLMNALLVHGLDYDDTHVPGVIHATASCFPCAFGVAAQRRASGKELLTAYVLGIETAARIGAVAKGALHQVGFHPTGVVGAFACSLIAARLFHMTPKDMTMAQGIALSLASGSLEFLQDGSWTKRIHPGWAGGAGITAASLARNGFVGPKGAYEGRFGLFPSHLGALVGDCDYSLATKGLGSVWELEQVAVKPYPACHFTHASADSAITLAREHKLSASDVESIVALVPAEVVKIVCEPQDNKKKPANGYDAQFSVQYVIASSFIRGKFGLEELENTAINDPGILALADRVSYRTDPDSPFPKYYSAELILTTKKGEVFSHREQINRGAAERPISSAEIVTKFMENTRTAMSSARAERIKNLVLSMEEIDDVNEIASEVCK